MTEPLVLRIDDLCSALDRALTAVKQRLGEEVIVEGDYYCHLPVEAAFDMAREPESLTVGRLSDDLLAVHSAGRTAPEVAWHDLSHLVGLLRILERLERE